MVEQRSEVKVATLIERLLNSGQKNDALFRS
ncbi:MAG: hypothetical protein RIR83_815 [Pseudomonadota bacterium]|jgi:hypothetical protein